MIVFYVQGGGLGHLTRTHRLIQHLNIAPQNVLIISPSSFTHHFKQYCFIRISWNDTPKIWSDIIRRQLANRDVQQCYIDAFPLGIKGELIAVFKALPEISFIYICRILRWSKYLSDMPESFSPNFKKTIVLERLYEEHFSWVKETSREIDYSPILLEAPKKHLKLADGSYVLVVHSGGLSDVVELCKKVQADVKNTILPIYIFSQVSVVFDDERFLFRPQEYPVRQYFRHACHIYTAAGFNLMSELASYQEKHTVFPIDRFYDDQFFRVKNRPTLPMK